MRSYEFLPHTADIKVLARGDTLDEAVMAAADALLASITDIAKVQDDEVIDITVRQPDLETLLVSALEELLFYHETEGMVFKRLEVGRVEEGPEGWLLHGTAHGQFISGHLIETEIKAITYNDIRVEQGRSGWIVQIVFDI